MVILQELLLHLLGLLLKDCHHRLVDQLLDRFVDRPVADPGQQHQSLLPVDCWPGGGDGRQELLRQLVAEDPVPLVEQFIKFVPLLLDHLFAGRQPQLPVRFLDHLPAEYRLSPSFDT